MIAVKFDTSGLDKSFEALSGKEVRTAGYKAQKAGANLLKRMAVANFKRLITKNRRGKGKLVSGKMKVVRVIPARLNRGHPSLRVVWVTIYSGGSGHYLAPIFNGGTKVRYTKGQRITGYTSGKHGGRVAQRKGEAMHRGRIIRGRYFERAIEEGGPQVQVAIQTAFEKEIQKAINKR